MSPGDSADPHAAAHLAPGSPDCPEELGPDMVQIAVVTWSSDAEDYWSQAAEVAKWLTLHPRVGNRFRHGDGRRARSPLPSGCTNLRALA